MMLGAEDVGAAELNVVAAVEVHGPVERLQQREDDGEGHLRRVVDLPQVLRRVLGSRLGTVSVEPPHINIFGS